jgi:hypothetical protein
MPRQTLWRIPSMTTSLISEAQNAIAVIGGEWRRDEKRPDYLRRVARACGLSGAAIERIFYGKRKRLYADEYVTLKTRLAALQERRAQLETAHAIYAERAAARDRSPADGDAQSPGRGGAALRGSGAVQETAGGITAGGESTTRLEQA